MQSTLDHLIDNIVSKKSIFKSKEALRHTFTPKELPHREKEIKALLDILVAPLKQETPSNLFLYGKTGTGKTLVSRFVCECIKEKAKLRDISFEVLYLNCELVDTGYRVLAKLATFLGKEVPPTGWPTDKVYEEFFEAVEANKGCVVVILDEIDKLVKKVGDDDILYHLSRINQDLKNSKLSLIGISNILTFREKLDARVKSSLSQEEIVFPPYDAIQLKDILWQRVKLGLNEKTVDELVVSLCSALAAREHGDARRALDLLRISAEIADKRNASSISEKDVREAYVKIETDKIEEAVNSLPLQTKVILASILSLEQEESKIITSGDVYLTYSSVIHNLDIERLTSRRVSDHISELSSLGLVETQILSRGRRGRTKEIKTAVPITKLINILKRDSRLSDFTHIKSPRQLTLV